ncbi:MAG: 2-oxo acid dehydrogenase subunit E2, partial [Alphaproteobacteria bacterium]|nr:2-oxo acid dehydrogenase subunit E2 [Alphaproteobacteria bacterium]
MAVEIKVPSLGESVTEVTVAKWLKNLGDMVTEGDPLVELETDKATQEIYAPQSGLLISVAAPEGSTQAIGSILGRIGGGADVVHKMSNGEAPAGPIVPPVDASHFNRPEAVKPEAMKPDQAMLEHELPEESLPEDGIPAPVIRVEESRPIPRHLESEPSHAEPEETEMETEEQEHEFSREGDLKQLPGVERMLAENQLEAADINGSGRDGRLTKEDILAHIERQNARHLRQAPSNDSVLNQTISEPPIATKASADGVDLAAQDERSESLPPALPPQESAAPVPEITRQKMSRLRLKIAERLKEAQNTAAMLTTFNEVDMTAIMKLRAMINPAFEAQNGVKLGLMSLFVKASIAALHDYPAVNAEISGNEILYKKFYDIGVAVGTDRGLVVPVLRGADQLSYAEIETQIADMGSRARSGKLSLEEMSGGSFTITNGGVYGSLLSTPILNPPQSGILGMHKIQ